MPMKLDGHFLNNMTAMHALRKLNDTPGLNQTAAYRISRIHDRCEREIRTLSDRAIILHREYCLVGEDGIPTGLHEGKLTFIDPAKEAEHDARFKELLDYEFEEKALPIPLSALGPAGLTPKEISSLEPIIEVTED